MYNIYNSSQPFYRGTTLYKKALIMKKIIFLLLLLTFYVGNSQNYENQWKEVVKNEIDGKTKSASEAVNQIYKNAHRKNNDVQIVKCFFYQSKFIQALEEDAQTKIIENLRKEIRNSSKVNESVLNYLYATLLQKYLGYYRHAISQRTTTSSKQSDDFLTWTATDFENEINKAFEKSIKNDETLHSYDLLYYKEILEISPYTDAKNSSLFDFIFDKNLTYYKSKIYDWRLKNNANIWEILMSAPSEFIKFNTEKVVDLNLKKVILLMQLNESFYMKNNQEKLDAAYYERLKLSKSDYTNTPLFQTKIEELEKTTTNQSLQQQLRLERVQYWYSITEKGGDKNYYSDALTLIDSMMKSKVNPNALAEAELIKNKIIAKTLTLQVKKIVYPNENLRAFVNFKTVDSITVHYYRLPTKLNDYINNNRYYRYDLKPIDTDSLVLDFISKNKAITSFQRILPNKKDYFSYSTEILLEKMEVGNYLIFIETKNTSDKNEKVFAYENVVCTNFNYLQYIDLNNDTFNLVDRKTGKPIENAIAKNDDTTTKSDSKGKVSFRKVNYSDGRNYSDLYFIKENDTLLTNYHKSYFHEKQDERFEAKSMVYFDRAIYRPGQKVHFKGILMQKKGKEKSIVPFVTVKVIIQDSEENELKEFETQTNEFGSFTSEFDIPKNILTGEFSVVIEEPDNYENDSKYYDSNEDEHSFWDEVDYNDYQQFRFQVEEYKRPTFEVKFDTITENYTIGDVIKVKGNAKTLAGSNLTNAKVAYTVSRNLYLDDDYDRETNYINSEITTDENGNFTIEFLATKDSINNSKIDTINYTVDAVVTDINGETRKASRSLTVGKKMLRLNVNAFYNSYVEEPLKININATTLNDHPINTKGEVSIYSLEKKQFLLDRTFYFPEIQTLTRSEFELLFPYEPYDASDNLAAEKLIKKINFDTKESKTITIDDAKSWKVGEYKINATAQDQNKNEITYQSNFNLQTKRTTLSKSEFFTYTIASDLPDYFEIVFNSIIPDLYITTRFFDKKEYPTEIGTQLINGTAKLKIKKSGEFKNDVHFHFSTFWENQYREKTHTVNKETIEKKLELEIISLRNKIEPGSKETWSFKIKDNKSEAEFLASMYDSSLDQFKTTSWETIRFYDYTNVNYPRNYVDNKVYLQFNNFYAENNYYKTYSTQPDFYWFGFDFIHPKNAQLTKKYLERATMIAETPRNAKLISGYVLDDQGPLPGANVVVKGTTRGVQTDMDGYFEIEVAKGETIDVSFIGMTSKQIKINDKQIKSIKLETSAMMELESVVVTGYAKKEMKAKSLTSSTVEYDIVEEDNNMLTKLQGQVAGLNITNANGTPGTKILIRGIGSISDKNEPLYVVDGIPLTREEFLKLNPNDMLSVTMLKDSAASAIYGNRASNGVIVIVSKSAMKELTQVKTRTNFNETAFFFPQLKTDVDGKIVFSFTTPESLTKWNLRLYAHNKKGQTGSLQADVISQKDLMMMPNMPRFVREKDKLTVSAKVVNMTNEIKSGLAMLLLYDATNMKPIDSLALNKNNVINFSCKPKESVPVQWTITIPEHLQGLQYKIVAKSGNFSDGEENILPVLTNKILVTESIPLWVRGNTKKEYVFENLKNNTSTTLQNHSMTLEYTTNPVWLALQSLPYLLEYQHECAEQTFARYYANTIATEIINSNPKIVALFESWKTKGTPPSKLEMNEELKSTILAESPWLMDAKSEDEKNKRLALLFDLNTLKEKNDETFKKLTSKLLPSGGFPWFDGGNQNIFISQHIMCGIGHLNTLFPKNSSKYETIIKKGIPNLDLEFVGRKANKNRLYYWNYTDLHYLYTRSFFVDHYPLPKKVDSLVAIEMNTIKKDWLTYSLYQKGMIALVMHRFKEHDFAKKIITHLKESSSTNADYGMYWIENSGGYYWYNSSIETQALLIEAFSEIENDKQSIEAMKVWLIKNKQSQNWPTTKSTSEAIYALLLQGNDWTSVKENTKIKLGDEKVLTKKLAEKQDEAATGYFKLKWNKEEINTKMATISIDNKSDVPGFGGVYWQYFEELENIQSDSTATLSISKKLFKKIKTTEGNQLVELDKETIKVGDLITIRLIVRSKDNLEFVHLKDLRASCFEPVDVISNYHWGENTDYYKSTKDVATHFFFDDLQKGTYVFEYDVRVNNLGEFNDGIATIQSMYAPEYGSHSTATHIEVK